MRLIDDIETQGRTQATFYRTSAGAEIDLVLELPKGGRWAIEIKRGLAARVEKGFHIAREDLKPAKSFVVYSGTERYPVTSEVEAIGVRELADMLLKQSAPAVADSDATFGGR